MRVALIGDIHANLPALEVVLNDAVCRGVDAVWNIGDSVGYGPFPDEVVSLLRERCAINIIGNYDRKVLQVVRGKGKWHPPRTAEKKLAFEWTFSQLSAENLNYLRSLPDEMYMEYEGRRIWLIHGDALEPDMLGGIAADPQRWLAVSRQMGADIIIFGHSHIPFARCAERKWFINTGSVGRPDDGDARASYALLRIEPELVEVTHYRVVYDVDCVVETILAKGLPAEFARMLRKGVNLNDLRYQQALEATRRLSKRLSLPDDHVPHVTMLALQLFDHLQPWHTLGPRERRWLEYASLLHDIGWSEGQKAHHKTALRIILESPELPFQREEREVIGSIARYHRRALPSIKHEHFAALSPENQRVVRILSAILRVADGLDSNHLSLVQGVRTEMNDHEIVIYVRSLRPAEDERLSALEKADLMEQEWKRKVVVKWDIPQ